MTTIYIMCAELSIARCTYTVFHWIVGFKPIVIAEKAKTAKQQKKKKRSGIVIFTMSRPCNVLWPNVSHYKSFFRNKNCTGGSVAYDITMHDWHIFESNSNPLFIFCSRTEVSVVHLVWPIGPSKLCYTKCSAIWINIRLNFRFISESWKLGRHNTWPLEIWIHNNHSVCVVGHTAIAVNSRLNKFTQTHPVVKARAIFAMNETKIWNLNLWKIVK